MKRCDHLINGVWTPSTRNLNVNPGNLSDVIGEYAEGNPQLVAEACAAAAGAFHDWRFASPELRSDILHRVGEELLARQEELGRQLSREEGKTLAEGIGEVVRAGRIFRYYAGEALRVEGERLASVRPGVDIEIIREPEGAIGVITPWNFPIAIPAWKVAPALAYGNTVVLKSAELTPASAWSLAELLHRAGIPKGVFNLVMGGGAAAGEAMTCNPDLRAISFTGSVAVGRRVGLACMETGKKVQLEMGGKNPLIVAADADIDNAVEVALNGSFYSSGQRCTASSRLIVESGIHDHFVEKLAAKVSALKVGDALDPTTQIGPLVSEAQLTRVTDYAGLGTQEGASLVAGGETITGNTEGYYMQPTLLAGATNGMRINREEIFGPVATVIRANSYDEAVEIANDTSFGLASAICTTSLAKAADFKRRSRSGMVMVNLPTAGVDYHVPFGGRGHSSYGSREQGKHARDFYTWLRTAYTKY